MIRMLLAPLRMLNPRVAGLARLPIGALLTIVCTLMWILFVVRGVCFPLVVHDPQTSWGGPTMAGAWIVHFALLAMILLVLHGIAYVLNPGPRR